jgi:CO/xanthine dehydrogenase FAD-binding subunit
VANCALVLDVGRRHLACALGAVGPVAIRDHDAERSVAARLDWEARPALDQALVDDFGRRMAAASRPIDDHRATAAYRRHAVEVLARRALARAWGAT